MILSSLEAEKESQKAKHKKVWKEKHPNQEG